MHRISHKTQVLNHIIMQIWRLNILLEVHTWTLCNNIVQLHWKCYQPFTITCINVITLLINVYWFQFRLFTANNAFHCFRPALHVLIMWCVITDSVQNILSTCRYFVVWLLTCESLYTIRIHFLFKILDSLGYILVISNEIGRVWKDVVIILIRY